MTRQLATLVRAKIQIVEAHWGEMAKTKLGDLFAFPVSFLWKIC